MRLHTSSKEILEWYGRQRKYYSKIINDLVHGLENTLPGIIFSLPKAESTLFLDFKNITPNNFNISKFIDYCSLNGKVKINNRYYTLLLSPMKGFYFNKAKGGTQARIALVENELKMKIVPELLSRLLKEYLKN